MEKQRLFHNSKYIQYGMSYKDLLMALKQPTYSENRLIEIDFWLNKKVPGGFCIEQYF